MSLDIRIFEIYGMSESSGPQLSTTSENQKLCTIGKELPGFWAKIAAADGDRGELCVKGRHVMMGYLNNPEKTAEVLGEDGWLRSGDIASKVRHGIGYRHSTLEIAYKVPIYIKGKSTLHV